MELNKWLKIVVDILEIIIEEVDNIEKIQEQKGSDDNGIILPGNRNRYIYYNIEVNRRLGGQTW